MKHRVGVFLYAYALKKALGIAEDSNDGYVKLKDKINGLNRKPLTEPDTANFEEKMSQQRNYFVVFK